MPIRATSTRRAIRSRWPKRAPRTFGHRKKLFLVSTPTIKGLSRIEREYEASDQRRYFVPCPHCGHMQWLQFERLRWDKGKPETAAYICECLRGADPEAAQDGDAGQAANGVPRQKAQSRAAGLSSLGLYSPVGWFCWADIARSWDEAQPMTRR